MDFNIEKNTSQHKNQIKIPLASLDLPYVAKIMIVHNVNEISIGEFKVRTGEFTDYFILYYLHI